MSKFDIGDKVRIVDAMFDTMIGVEGIITYFDTRKDIDYPYLLRIDATKYKHRGWRISSDDDCVCWVPSAVEDAYLDDTRFSFWWAGATELERISAKDEKKDYHDKHYTECLVEPIVLMQAVMTKEQFKGFLIGNALKYRLRAGHKEDAQKDIDKALRYEQWLKEYEQEGEITI